MKIVFLFILFFINGPIYDAKLDTGLLLIIESSIQNNDYDIICALRESLFNLTGQNDDGEFDYKIAIAYIDKLHQCNPVIEKMSTTDQNIYTDESDFEEGLFKN